MSLKTHSFEIFDSDFDEYVLITNENQLIENLSRIRIRFKDPKPVNNAVKSHKLEGSLEGLSLTTSESTQNKPILPTDQKSDDKNWFTHYFFESNNNNFAKNSEKTTEMKDKNVYQKRQSLPPRFRKRFEEKSRPKPINYMELPYIPFTPMEFYSTHIIHFGDKPLIGIRYRSDVFKAIKSILESIFRLKALRHLSFENQWKAVSDDMLSNGWTGYSPEKSRKHFFRALNLYKKSLELCPDFETAFAVNPLFNAFHSTDTKPILTSSEYKEITNLKQMFDEKNQRMESLINSTVTHKMSEHRKAIDGPKMRKMQNLSPAKISWFKMLAQSVDGVAKDYGPLSVVTDFWELVAQSMRDKGFKFISPQTCHSAFREYVNDYFGTVLFHSSDTQTARKMYPLFDLIDSMDLSKCLTISSYQKIKALKEKFNENESLF